MAAPNLNELVLDTLNLLDWRLKRLEFILNGTKQMSPEDASNQTPVTRRIQKLEQGLSRLCSKNETVSQILQLRMSSTISRLSAKNKREHH